MPQSLSNLLYHMVWSTKYRCPVITDFREDLYHYIYSTITREGGKVFAINGTNDHIHVAAKLLPKHKVSALLHVIKGNSSRWINEQNKSENTFMWQAGYGAFSISKSKLKCIIQYIKNQEKHHRLKSFKDEYIELLQLHDIEYDERHLWN
ncbi:IS200/IS605 family transposase [Chitinispirillales bacterium ANBcel5]|uniref:IS200/IS605 family transposase n=1 Tax=Cellulosispirillum alkaliphilum TaxID=3039283 RepID=UPI002A553B7A|nr:IS200/IS605 family transposase [Chitinispirillales bacterium ANBcel5]